MDKYYTPEIEEFHVGFEFESNYVLFNNTGRGSEWKKIILDDDQFGWFYSAYTNDAVDSEFRVKYLDKEDIESLGFEELANNWFFKDAPGKLAYWTQVIIDFKWMEKEKHYKDISILGTRGKEDDIIFRGNIKNKSELKKLLKQLNIK